MYVLTIFFPLFLPLTILHSISDGCLRFNCRVTEYLEKTNFEEALRTLRGKYCGYFTAVGTMTTGT